jgi:hypothetical protein
VRSSTCWSDDEPWKRYPHVPHWDTSGWFTFPVVDGTRGDVKASRYSLAGFVRGCESGRDYAYLVTLDSTCSLAGWASSSWFGFALFDCDGGRYGSSGHWARSRRLPWLRRWGLVGEPDSLTATHRTPAGNCHLVPQRTPHGGARPFAWQLSASATDHRGSPMLLELEIEARRPPGPVGDRGGELMFLGCERTHAYWQGGLKVRGELRWGEHAERVEGSIGWLQRNWDEAAARSSQNRRRTRYRHESRFMSFDNGWEMCSLHQYDRHRDNATVPWSGISAQGPGPGFVLRATHRVELRIPEFIGSPGVVRARRMLTEGPRYFPHRYQLSVPEWDTLIESRPCVEAPAHPLAVESWNGPVRLTGRVFGDAVSGLGFDERTRPWVRDFELASALRLSTEHMPDLDDGMRRRLACRAWEVEAMALGGNRRRAVVHLAEQVSPLLDDLPHTARSRLSWLIRDLRVVLERRFAPPR